MKNITEALGEIIGELAGAAAVIVGLCAAIAAFRAFGDYFIGFFI